MSRKAATQVVNNFSKGLVTEGTALNFPENAATETNNCVFDGDGRITRRLGVDYEDGFIKTSITKQTEEAFTEYVWNAVAGDGNVAYLVQQVGSTLHFFNISNSTVPSANKVILEIDLDTYLPSSSLLSSITYPCQYTTIKGNLIVTNKVLNPFRVSYDRATDTFSNEEIRLTFRDFEGVDDGLELTERPVTDSYTSNPEHYYNLLNQGWFAGSSGTVGKYSAQALVQWNGARTDLPSNADIPSLYRASVTDMFDNANVIAAGEGNSPAPKGHFILEVANVSRSYAATADGFSLELGDEFALIPYNTGTNIGNTTNTANAFNDDSTEAVGGTYAQFSGTQCYIGKDYSSAPKSIFKAAMLGTTNHGFVNAADPAITFYLCGKNGSAPTGATDFGDAILATTVYTDVTGAGGVSLVSNDPFTKWDYVYFITTTAASQNLLIVEVRFWESNLTTTDFRPESVCTFAGRLFYSGPQESGLSGTVFFTQVIESNDQYGKCYQKNDPTAEDFNALLPDDGGAIQIAEIGVIKKLFPYQSSVLVLANNGIWLIKGGQGGFAANSYSIRKLSSLGMDAVYSVVDYKGLPLWWAEDGIYTITYEANYDSFKVESISDKSIKSFVDDIPRYNRQFIKGAYDTLNNIVYWLYNDEASLAATSKYIYTKQLCLDMSSGAFYPWTFGTSTPKIRGIVYVNTPSLDTDSVIKYTTTESIDSSNEYITYSDVHDDSYADWDTFGAAVDYESYFITGYKIHGETMRYAQPNYIIVFLDTVANSSCFLRALYDFSNSGNSGKWSTSQQIYNLGTVYRDINYRRLKIRGKGKSIQFKFVSESGKPFSIIGWAMKETQNADI